MRLGKVLVSDHVTSDGIYIYIYINKYIVLFL